MAFLRGCFRRSNAANWGVETDNDCDQNMLTYQLKKYDGSGRLKGLGEFDGADDQEVIAWAKKLPGSCRYELWCEDRLIYQSSALTPPQRPVVAGPSH
jgi:hypothetical protein